MERKKRTPITFQALGWHLTHVFPTELAQCPGGKRYCLMKTLRLGETYVRAH